MNTPGSAKAERCSAQTAAAKPCRYPALPGSEPPLCELHGKIWERAAPGERGADRYGRFLDQVLGGALPRGLAPDSPLPELLAIQIVVEELLHAFVRARGDEEAVKLYVPHIFRGAKLILDLKKELGSAGQEPPWNDVLDRLGDELDIEI